MASGGIIRRPAVPPPVRIRQDINKLPVADPIVTFYSRAIGVMKSKPITNPLSWRYQAAIHDYPSPDGTLRDRAIDPADPATADRDPLADARDVLPADRGTFWRQCQHFSWFFLPWHRMYLHHFERIVLAEVVRLGGPADWALPYWKWDATDGDGRIPVAFRNPRLADGSQNHLFVSARNDAPGQNANAGDRIATDAQMDKPFRCLRPTVFAGNGQFGGPRIRRHGGEGPPETVPPGLDGLGGLEGTPHGSMHVATGGRGFMTFFTQAALDPIFWLHHCNVDRLWEVWVQRAPGNRNPDQRAWLDESFAFHDATGGSGTMTVREVLNTRRPPLLYEYDDTTDPLAGP
jgi:tyrosinase